MRYDEYTSSPSCILFGLRPSQGATEPIFTKAVNYKKTEGLESTLWHFNTSIPQCFSQNYFLKICSSEKKSNLDFSKTYLKKKSERGLYLQNMNQQHTILW